MRTVSVPRRLVVRGSRASIPGVPFFSQQISFRGHLLASRSSARYHLRLMSDITQLLTSLEQADPHAASQLQPLVPERFV
jgi:hypothetical protein